MGYVIRMPQMGMEMDQGEVVAWEANEGDEIDADEVVAVVESEKATNEVEAREDGILRRIVVDEGGVVEPGTPIGILAGADEDSSRFEEEIERSGVDETETDEAEAEQDQKDEREDQTPATAGTRTGAGDGSTTGRSSDRTTPGSRSAHGRESQGPRGRSGGQSSSSVRATPGAKQLASEGGVDLTAVEGTGPRGVVTEDDVENHLQEAGGGATRTAREARDLSGIQETVAERLGESDRNAVHVTVKRSFDAGTIEAVGDAAESAGVDVSPTDLLLAAVGRQLDAHPGFNALYEDDTHRLIAEVNVGVAVDVEDGLLTPVIPSVDEKSVEEIASARTQLVERVTAGEFTSDDLSGGTFTVTNLGPFGVDSFDPVINPPEVAILGVGRIRDDGTMTLSLSFDHRVVNGADAARFLNDLVVDLTDLRALVDRFEADVV
jgi:pyruvate dehydrogenase E2 component (dihydrolipoamide acetyltransferase)